MAQIIMGHGVSRCFGTSLAPMLRKRLPVPYLYLRREMSRWDR